MRQHTAEAQAVFGTELAITADILPGTGYGGSQAGVDRLGHCRRLGRRILRGRLLGEQTLAGAGYLASANSLSAAIVESAGPIADALIP